MSNVTAAAIKTLCDDWYAASYNPNGDLVLGMGERYRLLENGIQFHELDFDALRAAVIGLSKVLLLPGLNTVVADDHLGLWSWCGEVLLPPEAQIFPEEQWEIRSLFEVAVHAALADAKKPVTSEEEWQEQLRVSDLQPLHAQQLIRQSNLALSYLVFPLLEALTKRACSAYVSFDGTVTAEFSVIQADGKSRSYKIGKRCSSLRDLLFLHYTTVSSPQLKTNIEDFRHNLQVLVPAQDPFDTIYLWRNQSLHGSATSQTIGGTILNLSILILLFEIEPSFEQHKARALQNARIRVQSSFRSARGFYPPY